MAIQIVTIINALHHSKAQFTSTADPQLDQMIERAMAATDVKEVEQLVGEMHRYLYDNANNITIGEIHTNYAANRRFPPGIWVAICTTTTCATSFGSDLLPETLAACLLAGYDLREAGGGGLPQSDRL